MLNIRVFVVDDVVVVVNRKTSPRQALGQNIKRTRRNPFLVKSHGRAVEVPSRVRLLVISLYDGDQYS